MNPFTCKACSIHSTGVSIPCLCSWSGNNKEAHTHCPQCPDGRGSDHRGRSLQPGNSVTLMYILIVSLVVLFSFHCGVFNFRNTATKR